MKSNCSGIDRLLSDIRLKFDYFIFAYSEHPLDNESHFDDYTPSSSNSNPDFIAREDLSAYYLLGPTEISTVPSGTGDVDTPHRVFDNIPHSSVWGIGLNHEQL